MKLHIYLLLASSVALLVAGCSRSNPIVDNTTDNDSTNTTAVDTVGNWPPFNVQPFKSDLPGDFYLATIAQKGNTIYFIGGADSTWRAKTQMRAFDLTTGTWSEKAPIAFGRYEAGAVVVGDYLYLIGGRDDSPAGTAQRKVERYDIATDRWTTLPDIAMGSRDLMRSYDGTFPNHFTSCNGRIYALNSPMRIYGTEDTLLSLFESSDGDHWTEHRSQFRRSQEPTMVASDDRVYIFGKRSDDSTNSNYMYEFDPATGKFTARQAPKYSERGYLNRASMYADGKIFKLNSYEKSPKIMEVYSVASDSWSQFPVPYNVTNNAEFIPIVTGEGEVYFFSTPHIRNGFYLNTGTNAFFTR